MCGLSVTHNPKAGEHPIHRSRTLAAPEANLQNSSGASRVLHGPLHSSKLHCFGKGVQEPHAHAMVCLLIEELEAPPESLGTKDVNDVPLFP